MALEQRGQKAKRLRRTDAARTLDPTEKGAINYFLGLAITKLFASTLLDAPWLLHLDVFRPLLNPVLTKRSRPDLVGETTSGRWLALECKGRGSKPDETAKSKAKDQALRLTSVSGAMPWLHIGAIAYFRNDILQFTWRDPPGDPRHSQSIELDIGPEQWRYYYLPVLELVSSEPGYLQRMLEAPILMPVQSADISVGIHPRVLRDLLEKRWDLARQRLSQHESIGQELPYHVDGIAVVAGPTWHERLVENLE